MKLLLTINYERRSNQVAIVKTAKCPPEARFNPRLIKPLKIVKMRRFCEGFIAGPKMPSVKFNLTTNISLKEKKT